MKRVYFRNIQRLPLLSLALALAAFTTSRATAEDWGVYTIMPVSAQTLVLEAVDAGRADGTLVSINKPAGGAHQKWIITPRVTKAISRNRWTSVSKRNSISSLKICGSYLNVVLVPCSLALAFPITFTGAFG